MTSAKAMSDRLVTSDWFCSGESITQLSYAMKLRLTETERIGFRPALSRVGWHLTGRLMFELIFNQAEIR
jgi:hypothetical protein